jgi:hypothetical protein
MPSYFPDTNILIDFGRVAAARDRLEHASRHGTAFLIAPPALIELVRGMVSGGRETFPNDKQVFVWLRVNHFPVLDLPRPFMAGILHSSTRISGVEPHHYAEQIETIADAANFEDFLQRSNAPGSAWRDIAWADEIHRAELDKEFLALDQLAKRRPGRDLAQKLSQLFGIPGCRPIPIIIERQFSAAIEFLESSIVKVRSGAKPRRNDPGLYTDFQLLLYLGSQNLNFLTREDFSHEIKRSPQRTRIVHPDTLT